jgi:hypothetical protein
VTDSGFSLLQLTGIYLYDINGVFLGAGGTYMPGSGNFVVLNDVVWTVVNLGTYALCYCPLIPPDEFNGADSFTVCHSVSIDGMVNTAICRYDSNHLVVAGQDSYMVFNTDAHSFTTHALNGFGVPRFFTPYDADSVIAYNTASEMKMINGDMRSRFYEVIKTSMGIGLHYGYVNGTPNAFTEASTLTSASFKDKPTGQSSAHFTSIECPSLMREIEKMIQSAIQ